jgi:hypothetical protein
MIHPTARTWKLPPDRPDPPGVRRTNLRSLAARPGRFEHHLTIVARLAGAQLEIATASEPLAFAHANVSDEYAIALRTGDPLMDAAPFRVFLSDGERDLARINHRALDLVLHPHGFFHWPGRLRAPYDPPAFPGPRRAVLSLVFCASEPTPPLERPLFVAKGREEDAKIYGEPAPPLLLAPLLDTAPGPVARIGSAIARLMRAPMPALEASYVVVLEADGDSFECDLIHVPRGVSFEDPSIRSALVFSSDQADPEPPEPSWDRVPDPPFAPFDEAYRVPLPFVHGDLRASDAGSDVEIAIANAEPVRVPRYWLARLLFRLALHGFALGRVETYGGFFSDDGGEDIHLGVRDRGSIAIARSHAASIVRSLYCAIAPIGYREELE